MRVLGISPLDKDSTVTIVEDGASCMRLPKNASRE